MTAHVTGRPRQHSKLQDTGYSRLGAHIRISSGCGAILRRNFLEGLFIFAHQTRTVGSMPGNQSHQCIYQLARTAITLKLPDQKG